MEVNCQRIVEKERILDGKRSTGKEIDEICPYFLS
jgi:hypothetical protein